MYLFYKYGSPVKLSQYVYVYAYNVYGIAYFSPHTIKNKGCLLDNQSIENVLMQESSYLLGSTREEDV